MRRNNTSNQTSVLDNVFSGFPNLFGPPNTGASRNTNRNGCESRAPAPNSYSPQTNIIYLSQKDITLNKLTSSCSVRFNV